MKRVFQRINLNIIPWVVLACSLLITFLLWRAEEEKISQQAEAQFELETHKIETAIKERLDKYELMLQGCIGMFNASVFVSRQEWKAYVQGIDPHSNYPGIQGIGFAPRVAAAEKAAHIRQLRDEGFPGYTVWPAGDRAEYVPIMYLEPFSGRNLRAFGFDMFSEPVRRAAMQEARDHGMPTLSGKVTLVQETTDDIQSGFLIYLPRYQNNRSLTTVQERRAALLGFVYSPFRAADFINGIFGRDSETTGDVAIEVYDGSALKRDNLLCRSSAGSEQAFHDRKPLYEKVAAFTVYGRTWTLHYKTLPSYKAPADRARFFIIVCGSLLVSFLLFTITFLVVARSKMLAAQIARGEQIQAVLHESEDRLNFALETIHAGAWTLDLVTRTAQRTPDHDRIFGYEALLPQWSYDMFLEHVLHEDRAEVDRQFRNAMKTQTDCSFQCRIKRADGETRWILVAGRHRLDKKGQMRAMSGIVQDITDRKQIENAQLFLLQCGHKEGEDFFKSLATYLAENLQADFVCIDKLVGDNLSACSLAMYCDGTFEDNLEYTLQDTPCGDVVGKTICSFPRDVRRLFPKDTALQELRAESYVGVTLWSSHGEPIGLIAVVGRKPLSDTSLAETLLKLVSIRAGGELERRQAAEELLKANKAYKALSDCGQMVITGRSEPELLDETVRIVHEVCGYRLVWIGIAEHDAAKTVRMAAQAGDTDGYLQAVQITWDDGEFGRGPTGSAIRTRKPVINHNTLTTPSLAPWRDKQIQHGFLSSAAFPIVAEKEVFGALMVYSTSNDAFTNEEIQLLMELSSNLAYSITFTRIDKERRQAEENLRTSNARLDILAETASQLLKFDSPKPIVELLCCRVMVFLDCHAFFNFLVDEARGQLHLNAYAGISQEEAATIEWLDYGTAVCGCAARDACRIVAEDILTTPDIRTELVKSYGIQAYACHPLMSQGEVIGTLSFGTRTRTHFTDDELSLMKAVADQVAIAMERNQAQAHIAKLNQDLQRNVQELEEEIQRRTHAEQILIQYTDELTRSNQELDSFTSVVSHDLQEPLRSIAGFMRLLDKRYGDQLDSRGREFISRALASSRRLSAMITSLLTYSRITTRGKGFEHHELDAIVETALENLSASISQTKAKIVREPLPRVYGDADQLVRVFQNLIGNSIKYCEDRQPEIHIAWQRKEDACILAVRDNAKGIDPDYLESIFDLFTRVSSKQNISGTGIGLAVCKKIIGRHNGRIWAESEPGKGSTFFISIPV